MAVFIICFYQSGYIIICDLLIRYGHRDIIKITICFYYFVPLHLSSPEHWTWADYGYHGGQIPKNGQQGI